MMYEKNLNTKKYGRFWKMADNETNWKLDKLSYFIKGKIWTWSVYNIFTFFWLIEILKCVWIQINQALINRIKKLGDVSYTTEKIYVIYIHRIIYYTNCYR